MTVLDSEAQLAEAIFRLAAIEPRFGGIVTRHGIPPLRRSEPGLRGLLRIVTDQLISLKAGEAIWRRIEAELHPFDADIIGGMEHTRLMALGLSGAKARTFQALAKAVCEGHLQFDELAGVSDDDVVQRLQKNKGIGPWTADIYLLSAMGRADAWPAGDLGLQAAAQDLFGLPGRPGPQDMKRLAEAWRPIRSVAARLLWSHYRGLKGMTQSVT